MDLRGSGARMLNILCRPVASWDPLKTFAAADWIPVRIKILRFWGRGSGGWMPGCWMLEGLEWIGGGDGGDGGIGMDARWEEGIGRNSHTVELHELGGLSVRQTS